MAIEIETEIVINSTIQNVWTILTEFTRYPDWTPFIIRLGATKNIGDILRAEVKLSDKRHTLFRPLLLQCVEYRELRWVGVFGPKWLLSGERYFILENIGPQRTLLVHGEIFSGLLAPLFNLLCVKRTKARFLTINQKLKTQAEMHTHVINMIHDYDLLKDTITA